MTTLTCAALSTTNCSADTTGKGFVDATSVMGKMSSPTDTVVASAEMAAILDCGSIPILLKEPPAYTVLPLTARACTSEELPPTFGSQGVARPLTTSNDAILFRSCPPMAVKLPPAYTVLPLTHSAYTVPVFAFGSHGVARPLDASSAAMRLRGCPPMVAKNPPTYNVFPLTASAFIPPGESGFQAVASPLAAS